MKDKFFYIFPELSNFMQDRISTEIEDLSDFFQSKMFAKYREKRPEGAQKTLETKFRVKVKLPSPIFELFTDLTISGFFYSFFSLSFRQEQYNQVAVEKLVNRMFAAFGTDSNDYTYFNPNNNSFVWLISVDTDNHFKVLNSYEGALIYIQIIIFKESVSLELDFVSTMAHLKDLGFEDVNIPDESWLEKVY